MIKGLQRKLRKIKIDSPKDIENLMDYLLNKLSRVRYLKYSISGRLFWLIYKYARVAKPDVNVLREAPRDEREEIAMLALREYTEFLSQFYDKLFCAKCARTFWYLLRRYARYTTVYADFTEFMTYVANKTGMTEDMVKRCITVLKRHGFVTVKRHNGRVKIGLSPVILTHLNALYIKSGLETVHDLKAFQDFVEVEFAEIFVAFIKNQWYKFVSINPFKPWLSIKWHDVFPTLLKKARDLLSQTLQEVVDVMDRAISRMYDGIVRFIKVRVAPGVIKRVKTIVRPVPYLEPLRGSKRSGVVEKIEALVTGLMARFSLPRAPP